MSSWLEADMVTSLTVLMIPWGMEVSSLETWRYVKADKSQYGRGISLHSISGNLGVSVDECNGPLFCDG